MSKNQIAADIGAALRRGDVPRPYLLTTPRQHYEDQAKLAMFEEMRVALQDGLEWIKTGAVVGVHYDDASVADSFTAVLAKVPA